MMAFFSSPLKPKICFISHKVIQELFSDDNGSAFIKAAIVGGREVTVPNIIGIQNPYFDLVNDLHLDHGCIIGDRATMNRGWQLIHPIVRGKIENFNAMIRVWRYVFITTLGIDSSNCSPIITEPAISDEAHRSQMFGIMFNEFNYRSILVASASLLAFYSRFGLDAKGILVEIGDSLTQVVPIFKGRCLDRAVKINEIGGCDITDKLADLLGRKYHHLTHPNMRSFITKIKEEKCVVAKTVAANDSVVSVHNHNLSELVYLGYEKHECETCRVLIYPHVHNQI